MERIAIVEDQTMPQTQVPPNVEEIKQLVFQLSPRDLLLLMTDIQEQLQTLDMTAIAESGFQEWNDPEEDIYNAEP
jgi:ABC-type lipopolysaccharide export system ATPase subunit